MFSAVTFQESLILATYSNDFKLQNDYQAEKHIREYHRSYILYSIMNTNRNYRCMITFFINLIFLGYKSLSCHHKSSLLSSSMSSYHNTCHFVISV